MIYVRFEARNLRFFGHHGQILLNMASVLFQNYTICSICRIYLRIYVKINQISSWQYLSRQNKLKVLDRIGIFWPNRAA